MAKTHPVSYSYTGESNPRTMMVQGPFGAGKTTYAINTLFAWLDAGVPAGNILVLVPQRTLAQRYLAALRDTARGPLGNIEVRTVNGLAKDMVQLYWPLVAEEAGFHDPEQTPNFLTIETAQYAMAEFVDRAVQRGEFDAINVSPQQIARQIIDNLGKAALLGIDYREIHQRLAAAWGPARAHKRILAYQSAGRVADEFRQYCLRHRLLDYSLQIALFRRLLEKPDFRAAFFSAHSHLIVDHLEEETTFTHDLVREWLPKLEAALLIDEWEGGYRVFLGADADSAAKLAPECEGILTLSGSYITPPGLDHLLTEVAFSFKHHEKAAPAPEGADLAFSFKYCNFYPEMLEWTAHQIAHLVHDEGIPPREIVVLAPFLSDALLFSLGQKLRQRRIESISHRPSRPLRDEPAARCILTLAALAHPQWGYQPPHSDVAQALHLSIDGLDPVRAQLLTKVVYRPNRAEPLTSFTSIEAGMQARITYQAGNRYERLREWLAAYSANSAGVPLDHTFSRMFGELLSQPEYGFHSDAKAGQVAYELVESARKFRQSLFSNEAVSPVEVGRRYFNIVNQGLLAALYVGSWRDENQADAILMVPAYTFLLRNRAVYAQFWLDVGATGWWERLDQPLTHPYVLSANWPAEQIWTDADEYYHQQDMLYRIMAGLIRRCSGQIYLGLSNLGEQGYEQRGPMLRIFQQILRRHPRAEETDHA
jgi:hypothetical protein